MVQFPLVMVSLREITGKTAVRGAAAWRDLALYQSPRADVGLCRYARQGRQRGRRLRLPALDCEDGDSGT